MIRQTLDSLRHTMAESIRAFASRDPSFVAVERAVSAMRETLARMIGRMWKATDADDNPELHAGKSCWLFTMTA